LAGFAFTGMMLDPYDKKSESQPNWVQHTMQPNLVSRCVEILFNFACAATTCICLLTVVYSNYLGLFSTRLALRGGEMAVEESVMKIRGEYKVVLYALTVYKFVNCTMRSFQMILQSLLISFSCL
jgi:hypothetical protein